MALRDDINIPLLVVLGLATALAVGVTILLTEALYNETNHRMVNRKYEQAGISYAEQIWAPQEQSLQGYRWADAGRQTAVVPIEQAMRRVVSTGGRAPATRPE
jgi:hypothetical protein